MMMRRNYFKNLDILSIIRYIAKVIVFFIINHAKRYNFKVKDS